MAGIDEFHFPFDKASSGLVLSLTRPAPEPASITLQAGTTVGVKGGRKFVAAATDVNIDNPAFPIHLHAAVRKALDVLAFRGDALAIDNDEPQIVWWKGSSNEKTIRVIGIGSPMSIRVRGTVEVRDAAGNIVPAPPEPPLRWHESFRYFRVSQTTSDLFDAYRNLYLALEALLSSIVPSLKPSGRKKREIEWLEEALTAALQWVDLSQYAAVPTNAIESLRQELYEQQRTSLFHAKLDRSSHLPDDASTREAVLKSLKRLARLYVDLAGKYLNMGRSGAGIGVAFVDGAAELVRGLPMCISDYSSGSDDTLDVLPEMATTLQLRVRDMQEVSEPYSRFFLGSINAAEVSLPHISRILWLKDRDVFFVCGVPGQLRIDGADRFEAQLGIRYSSSQLRSYYAG